MQLKYQEHLPISGDKPKQLVILLHGYGSNGYDLISIVPEIATSLPNAHFISPNAPFNFEGGGDNAYQWFSLLQKDEESMINGAKIAKKILDDFIDYQLNRFLLNAASLAVVGFSQGTMIGLYTALRRKEKIGLMLGYSGMLLGATQLNKEIISKPKVVLIHGAQDQVLPYQLMNQAKKALSLLGVDCQTILTPKLGHGIDKDGIDQGVSFLRTALVDED